MADDSYKTIKQIAEGYYTEKRSRFISYAIPVRTVEEVKEQLDKYRKQYYDARHVCWAYMLGPERLTFRANDDGEPSSTAGKPILGQINSNELTDILIIVVRYFGGIKLGTSGLIVAYKAAAADKKKAKKVKEVVAGGQIQSGYYQLPQLKEDVNRFILFKTGKKGSATLIYIEGELDADDLVTMLFMKKN